MNILQRTEQHIDIRLLVKALSSLRLILLIVALFLVIGCKNQEKSQQPPPSFKSESTPPAITIKYIDITKQAGIDFIHNHGGFGKKYLPESMGSGCAFLDYDNDGWQDVLLINSKNWPAAQTGKPTQPSYLALYRNNRDGTFRNVTKESGLAIELYGLGTSIADYDNDGDADIYITCLESDRLFRNNGDGTFADVTEKAGIADSDFGSSCTWFDYDKDGNLDLYVCNYVKWSIKNDLFCTLDGVHKSYCTPESYDGASPRLYRNRGDGTFQDVTKTAGLWDPTSKALGVVTLDYDNDGWLDLFVANDTQPNKLYRNKTDGTFVDNGVISGVAFSEAGVARAGMGVDAADYDNSGYPSILIGNFSNEMIGLYHNEGTGLFIDEAPASTVGQASLLTLTFGAFFFDVDLDGKLDLFAANGHVHDDIDRIQERVRYAQPPHLFRNLGARRFEEMTQRLGPDFSRRIVARGAAYGDIDNDGDLDILISTNGGPAHLLRNDGGEKNHFIRFKTVGKKSNRDGIGVRIVIHLNDGTKQWRMVKSSSSYCSQSELPVTFGLESQENVKLVEVFWPSGATQKLNNLHAGQVVTLQEPL